MPEQTSPDVLQRLSAMEEKVKSLSDEVASLKERKEDAHRKIYDRLKQLETDSAVNGERYCEILRRLSGLEDSLKELNQRPAKRWDEAVKSAISAVVGAVIGIVGTKLMGGG